MMNVAPKKKKSEPIQIDRASSINKKTIQRVDAIFTSDWHLREDSPICRMDDFIAAQWLKVLEIKRLAKEWNCPVIIAGDVFHHWKPSPFLLSSTKLMMPKHEVYVVYGQHDLPQHNFELRNKSGIYDLEVSGFVQVLEGGSWGQDPANFPILNRSVGVLHRFIWDGKSIPWPGCEEITAIELLKKYPDFDIIVTGDHHKPFVTATKSGRKIVNCGCLTRQVADYGEHRPRVWLYNAITNEVIPHFLKADFNAVSREHLEKKEARDERIEAFISRLDGDWEACISFEENLDRFFAKNKTHSKTKELIYKSID